MRIVFWLFCTLGLAFAQEVPKKELLERMVEPKLTAESAFLNQADIKGSSGGVSVMKNRIRINNEFASLSYTRWDFHWNGVESLDFSDKIHMPIKALQTLEAGVSAPVPINERLFILAQLSVSSSFEKEMQDSYKAGGFIFASYRLCKDHTIQTGAFSTYHPVRTITLPVLSYSYRVREQDGIVAVLGFPRTYVGYHATKESLFWLGALYSQSLAKLAKESYLAKEGYIEAKDYMANIGWRYRYSESLSLETDLLFSLSRDFRVYDKDADEVFYRRIENSWGASFALKWRL